jgi:hypothetical protein
MLTSHRDRWFRLAVLSIACVSACSDSSPIGRIECIGQITHCGFSPKLSDYDRLPRATLPEVEIASDELPSLAPSWSDDVFTNTEQQFLRLTDDGRGQLWSFRGDGKRLEVARLDGEGEELERHGIKPPEGLQEDALPGGFRLQDRQPQRHGALISLQWSGRCSEDPSRECWVDELLDWDRLDSAPRRVELKPQYRTPQEALSDGVHTWLLSSPSIARLDAQQRVLWRQTLPLDGQAAWSLSDGALQSSGALSALAYFGYGYELWTLNAFGNINSRIVLDGFWHEGGVLVVDARDRLVAFGTLDYGDLTIMRPRGDGPADGCVLVREEYRELNVDAHALDSAGAVYVITSPGGREQARTTLCRLSDAGDTDCHTLFNAADSGGHMDFHVDDLVVPEPGIVYLRSGARLLRYELKD